MATIERRNDKSYDTSIDSISICVNNEREVESVDNHVFITSTVNLRSV